MNIDIYYSVGRGKFIGMVNGKIVSVAKYHDRVEKAVKLFVKFGRINNKRTSTKAKSSFTVDTSVRDQLIKFTENAVNAANEKFPAANVIMPTVEFFHKTGKAGTVWHLKNLIKYNEALAKDNLSEFPNVALHEVAHIVTHKVFPRAKQAHGPEFKMVLLAMGGDGKRCHNMDVSSVKTKKKKFRAIYSCSCNSELKVSRNVHEKASKGVTFTCRQCKSKIEFTGKTKVIV